MWHDPRPRKRGTKPGEYTGAEMSGGMRLREALFRFAEYLSYGLPDDVFWWDVCAGLAAPVGSLAALTIMLWLMSLWRDS